MNEDIRTRRPKLGLKQGGVAKAANMTASELSKLERGFVYPTQQQYAELARLLGTDEVTLQKGQERYTKSVTPGEGYTTVPVEGTRVYPRRLNPRGDKWKVLDLFCSCGGSLMGLKTPAILRLRLV